MPRRRRRDTEGDESHSRTSKRTRIESSSEASTDLDVSDKENNAQNAQSMDVDSDTEEEIACATGAGSKIGIILKMHLRNFMCHENLIVEFNQNINLLVGVNGSGKSAIITAVAVGLGARASVTKRSENLQRLIKRDQNSAATIEIHLNNEGHEGYLPDVYGSKVIVLRTINASGGSYRLKNANGKVISQKREDLTKLLQFMNIQVDNPVVLLNQDESRTFLKDSDSKKLFELFMKATQIDSIISKLDDCQEHIVAAKASLDAKKKALNSKQAATKILQVRYDELSCLTLLKTKMEHCKLELAWSKVKELESGLQEKTKELGRIASEVQKVVDVIQNKENLNAEIQQKLQDLEQQIADQQRRLGVEETKLNELKELIIRKDDELVQKDREISKMHAMRKRFTEDMRQIEDTLRDQDADEVVNLRREHETELQKLSAQKDELDVQFANCNRELEMLRNSIVQIEDTFDGLKSKRDKAQSNIQTINVKVQTLRDSRNDKFSAYGPHMSKLVARIHEEFRCGKFSQLPRGPLGSFVEVPDRKWRRLVEFISFSLLNAFFVDSDKDRVALMALMKCEFPNVPMPTIITSNFVDKVYEVRQGMVQTQQGTVNLMQVMKIRDPVVTNCFIDQLKIETILLTENHNVAVALSETRANVPDNLFKVVVLQPFSEFYPEPNYRSYSLEYKECSILQTKTADLRSQAEVELRAEQAKLDTIAIEIQATRKRLEENQKSLSTQQQHNTVIIRNKRNLENKIQEIKNYEYPSENAIQVLRNELADVAHKLAEVEPMLEECRQHSEGNREEMKELTAKLDSAKTTKNYVEMEIQVLQNKLDAARLRLYEVATNNRTHEIQIERLKAQGNAAQREMDILTATFKQVKMAAQKVGPRVQVTNTKEYLMKLLQQSQARVKYLSTSTETPAQLKVEIQAKKQEEQSLDDAIKHLKETITFLNQSRDERYHNLKNLKINMASKVSHQFRTILKISRYKGNIEFDWPAKELRVTIFPQGQEKTSRTNAKSLSGGERSFSTVALLISLWCTIEHPFYFLDEFDVFTDHVTRHVITNLLIHAAEIKKDQFAFLTPQDMSQFSARPNLTIHRFADPIRK